MRTEKLTAAVQSHPSRSQDEPAAAALEFSSRSPASYWSADPNGVSALRKGSVRLRGFAVGEEAWVVHVLVGVAVFCEAHVLATAPPNDRRNGRVRLKTKTQQLL